MQHLKECPWDGGQAWRPARVPQAVSDLRHRADTMTMRNYAQHHQPSPKLIKPMGYEETIRMAVRKGYWPTQQQAKDAAFLPEGWDDFLSTQGALAKGSTLHTATMKVSDVARRHNVPGTLAAKYNLMPQNTITGLDLRPSSRTSEAGASEGLSSRASYTSSTSPMARSGCPMTASILPRSGSAPSLGPSYSFRNGTAASHMFTSKATASGGLQSIIAQGHSAGGRDFKGFAGSGRGTYIGF